MSDVGRWMRCLSYENHFKRCKHWWIAFGSLEWHNGWSLEGRFFATDSEAYDDSNWNWIFDTIIVSRCFCFYQIGNVSIDFLQLIRHFHGTLLPHISRPTKQYLFLPRFQMLGVHWSAEESKLESIDQYNFYFPQTWITHRATRAHTHTQSLSFS